LIFSVRDQEVIAQNPIVLNLDGFSSYLESKCNGLDISRTEHLKERLTKLIETPV